MNDDKATPADASSQSAAHDWLLGVAIGGYTGAEATHAQTLLAALAAERDRADRAEAALAQGKACICDPASVISDGPNVDCPQHGEATA